MNVAQIDGEDVVTTWRKLSETRRELLLLVGAIVLVSLIVFVWMAVAHKRRQRRERHHGRHESYPRANSTSVESSDSSLTVPHRRKWRRRRRDHRPRNPTLAETGGLPPIRQPPPPETPS